jgi:hypothetical protein
MPNALGSHFTKTHVLPILATKKWKIHFLNGKVKKSIYKSCWQWKDSHQAKNGVKIQKFAI